MQGADQRIKDIKEISIAIDTWDDIFSDFDPRPFEVRALSEDFIAELKKRYRETRKGQFLVMIYAPVSLKHEETERGTRFEARIEDRIRQWKLSAMDLPSRERWYDYSRARDRMLETTDTDFAPWYIVRSDDKRRARLNVLSHFLSLVPYEAPKRDKVKLPTRDNKNAYDDESTIKNRRWIEEKF